MDPDTSKLMSELRKAGLSKSAINAAWPSWWSDDIAASPSGRTELRFALARKLGLAPKALLGERVEFIWKDTARFKHLGTEDADQQSILNSFGVSVGRLVLSATAPGPGLSEMDALGLRETILGNRRFVDLTTLLAACWGLGVPVIQLKVFPLAAKSMHAMVVESAGRHAILIGRQASYPAPTAFTLAHEMGHIAANHLKGVSALIDVEDPAQATDRDTEENEADAFGLTVLTGTTYPDIRTDVESYNAPTLANAVMQAADEYRVEAGTLALCLAYRSNRWRTGMSALRFIYGRPGDVGSFINTIAERELDWSLINDDAADYLRNLMQLEDA